jgi:hypothetical protein
MEAKLDLAKKWHLEKRANTKDKDIQIQERFDKNPISRKTDIIGDDNLTGDYQKGGLVKKGKPKLAKKGWK